MSEKFENALQYVNGAGAYVIWRDLNTGREEEIKSLDSINELIEYFSFAISRNIIVEYDVDRSAPVFSGDSPQVVAQRIFGDFFTQVKDLPPLNPLTNPDFMVYLLLKRGWAVLVHGTVLVLPE